MVANYILNILAVSRLILYQKKTLFKLIDFKWTKTDFFRLIFMFTLSRVKSINYLLVLF